MTLHDHERCEINGKVMCGLTPERCLAVGIIENVIEATFPDKFPNGINGSKYYDLEDGIAAELGE